MAHEDYERRGDLLEIDDPEHLESCTVPGTGNETRFHVIPPIVVQPGTYKMMVRKSLIATGGRTVDAVSCRVEDDAIYIDPVYNATGQPGY